jgi:hypothetical protein
MIGWRPYLVTALALLVLAGAVLDVSANGRVGCASADALQKSQLLAKAGDAYRAVLKKDANSGCAKTGLASVTHDQCDRAGRIAASDPSAARTLLLAVASADPPVPATDGCVWKTLQALPPAK